jgi:hypothetical protein
MLHLQRCLDLLDQHLMASPHPAPPPIQVGRSWITDGALYSFRHPELGLLGSVCLLGNGSSIRIDIQISGHADDPTTAAHEAAFVPSATALSERFYASPMLVPKPGQPIPAITTAPAYRDPQQQTMREYRCARCQTLVACWCWPRIICRMRCARPSVRRACMISYPRAHVFTILVPRQRLRSAAS